jgi:hypothetical protein
MCSDAQDSGAPPQVPSDTLREVIMMPMPHRDTQVVDSPRLMCRSDFPALGLTLNLWGNPKTEFYI